MQKMVKNFIRNTVVEDWVYLGRFLGLFQEDVDVARYGWRPVAVLGAFGVRFQLQFLEQTLAGLSLESEKWNQNPFSFFSLQQKSTYIKHTIPSIDSSIHHFRLNQNMDVTNEDLSTRNGQPWNWRGTYDHEQDEEFEDLRRQVHGRRVGEVVDDEAEDGGGAQEVVHRGVQALLRFPVLARPDLRVQRAQVEQHARLYRTWKKQKNKQKKRLRTLAYLVSSAETPKRALLIGYRFLDNQWGALVPFWGRVWRHLIGEKWLRFIVSTSESSRNQLEPIHRLIII